MTMQLLNELAELAEKVKPDEFYFMNMDSMAKVNFLTKANPAAILAIAEYVNGLEEKIRNMNSPVMFIDGNISSQDADKLAGIIREFNEEDERPLAKMARIIRDNPHPTNECDMPKANHISDAGKMIVPDGWKLVPLEPTEEMNKAGWSAMNEHDAINPTYRAMLAAAPEAPHD